MDKTITLSKGGEAERTRDINEITIPDLWHIAMWLQDEAKQRGLPLKLSLKRNAEMILETWNLAHDLKRHIEES